jgi:hypothetical protein
MRELIDLEFDIYKYYSRELLFARKLGILLIIIYFLI